MSEFKTAENVFNFAAHETKSSFSATTTTTTTVYFNEVVFPSVLGLTSPMAFPQHSPPS